MKKIVILFLVLVLVLPFSFARERLNLNVEINSWCYEDNLSSRFNITLNGNERDLDIDDEDNYVRNDLSNNWNGSVTLRFDYGENTSDFCSGDMGSLIDNITNICQKRTEELEGARKFLEDEKADCETRVTNCNNEKTELINNQSAITSLENRYNECYFNLYGDASRNITGCVPELQKYRDSSNVPFINYGIAFLFGGLAYWGIFVKKLFGTKKSLADKEAGREPPKGDW